MTYESLIYDVKLQERGPDAGLRPELDPIRSEFPINAGSGFANVSAASINTVLSIPSGKAFVLKYLAIGFGAGGGSIAFYDGGSAASAGTTIFMPYLNPGFGSITLVTNQYEMRPLGVYVYSQLFCSGPATAIIVKAAGYMFAVSAPD